MKHFNLVRWIGMFLFLMAPQIPVLAQNHWCGTPEKAIATNPDADERALLEAVRDYIAANQVARSSDSVFVIPTVVHIIHWNGIGDITDLQVEDGIRVINEDFRKQNSDTSNTDSLFKNIAADVGLEFHLAQIDPWGNPTTGITRTDTSIIPHPEPFDSNFDNVKYAVNWPPHKYFNIWVVRSIMSGTLGYAQYPGTDFTYGGPWSSYGVVIRNSAWGTIGTANSDGRTATHEIGHCLGLYHTFLSTSAGCGAECDTTGDEVCDTPPCTITQNCGANLNTCSNDSLGPSYYANNVKDQKENYMSYNSCQSMFSLGQKARMLGFFNAFDTLKNLSSPGNLVATGLLQAPAGIAQNSSYSKATLSVYPNPASSNISIAFSDEEVSVAEIKVFDATGRLLIQKSGLKNPANFSIAQLPKGIYFVRATNGANQGFARFVVN